MLTVSIFFFSPVRESSGKVEEKNKERNEKERDRREVGRKRIQCHWRIYRKYKFNWVACVFVCFWPHLAACEILVSLPGNEPMPLALKVRNFNHWTIREFPTCVFVKSGDPNSGPRAMLKAAGWG